MLIIAFILVDGIDDVQFTGSKGRSDVPLGVLAEVLPDLRFHHVTGDRVLVRLLPVEADDVACDLELRGILVLTDDRGYPGTRDLLGFVIQDEPDDLVVLIHVFDVCPCHADSITGIIDKRDVFPVGRMHRWFCGIVINTETSITDQ